MAIIAKEKFSQGKMDKLREYLKMYYDLGQPIEYEILVDGFKAVRRTGNPELFSLYENFVNSATKGIEVLFFTGTSNNNDKHIFNFGEEAEKEKGLSGLEVDTRIQEGIEKEKKSWEFEQIKERNKELEGEVKELETEVEKLETELTQIRSSESPLKGVFGEIGSVLVESFIRRNPQILANLPGGTALAGIIEEDNKRLQKAEAKEPEPEMQVSFRASDEDAKDKEAQEAHGFVKYLKGRFLKEAFTKLMEVVELLADRQDKLDTVINQLKGKGESDVQI
jgi:hypothetical protein